MAYSQQKIKNLESKIKSVDEKLKSLLMQKKDYEKQIKEIEEQEILNAVISAGVKIDTLSDDLALAQLLRDNKISKQDILSLVQDNNENKNGGFISNEKFKN